VSLYIPEKIISGKFDSILFLDRDGVVIEDGHYMSTPGQVKLLPGVGEALSKVNSAGIKIVMITNQSGIGRGYFTENDFLKVQAKVNDLLKSFGVSVEAVAYCPHSPTENCKCRKPETGMIDELSEIISWVPENSYLVGDKISDIQLGNKICVDSWIVQTGHGKNVDFDLLARYNVRVEPNLPSVIKKILSEEK
jgi:D-glycero-D-manno-heptose 1,7-bisphosphate phosphatase